VATIREIMTKMGVQGGMALSSMYQVKIMGSFDFHPEWSTDQEFIELMCDEAQLPNVQAQTGLMTGRHLGEGSFQYAHTRVFSDLTLSFICDAEMSQLKFFTSWHDYIFGAQNQMSDGNRPARSNQKSTAEIFGGDAENMNKVIRVKYPKDYTRDIKIAKIDQRKNTTSPSIVYSLRDAYPYSLDTVPLAYGTSQLTKCTVNLYYKKHDVVYNSSKSKKED
jgi:hypothetical protein